MAPRTVTTAQPRIVFLLDVDNTLLDHDALKRRVTRWIEAHVEGESAGSFWEIYEEVRGETGIVDFLEAARRFGMAIGSAELGCEMGRFLWEHPFQELMFPGVIRALPRLKELGSVVVLCDGHELFQQRKVVALGLAPHLDGVLVFDHKELHIAEVLERFPADRYVMIDDKPRIHAAMKLALGDRVVTVLVRQGHYANVASNDLSGVADFSIDSFGTLVDLKALLVPR